MLDTDNSGYIDKDELRDKMEEGLVLLPSKAVKGMSKEAQIAKFFQIADSN